MYNDSFDARSLSIALTKMVYDIHVALLVLVQRFHGNKFWFDGCDGYRGKVTIVWRKRWRSKKCSMIWMVQWFILFWVKDLDGSWVETVWQYLKEKWWESNSLVEGVVVTRQERVCGGYCDESFKRFQKDWTNELTESHRGKEK